MLNKAMIIHELSMARIAHERWVKRAEHLISGMPVDIEFIPHEATKCGFGKWYYGLVGQTLKGFYTFTPTMENIEQCHGQLHKIYHEIYEIFFVKPNNRTLLHRLITLNSKKVTKHELRKAKECYAKLQETSAELIHLTIKLEKAVKATDLVVLYRQQLAQSSAVS